jgi:TRAP-type mannitol/chloroaromatic compound transport system permease small subunit
MNTVRAIAQTIDAFNNRIGIAVAWAALAMVTVQFVVVIMRYVYGIGSIFMQESVTYLHATLFMVGAGYTLLHGGHVRVDIFYRTAAPRRKALVDLFGVVLFLIPVCILIGWSSWPYVVQSWSVFEGSREVSGIQGVFLLKSVILVFVVLMILQGISLALHSIMVLAGAEAKRAADGPGSV